MNVLLVDDEPMMRRMLKTALEKRGVEVFDAANGPEALIAAGQHAVDVVVTDLVMDDMDGWMLASLLSTRYPDLPVLFISGYPADFQHERSVRMRSGFLQKPFAPGQLMDAITELLRVTV